MNMDTLLASPASATATGEERLLQTLAPLQARLAAHPLYGAIRTLPALRLFMQSHIFAVWDFMSLLKGLQRALTCVDLPWRPTEDGTSRRLINEIVLSEESDTWQGKAISHFELYLLAMREIGAETGPAEKLVARLRKGAAFDELLKEAPDEAAVFVRTTFAVLATGATHRIAAAFAFGREELIPEIFPAFVREMDGREPGRVALFRYYLERHIELDGDEHGPMSMQMMRQLCRTEQAWKEAAQSAAEALEARLALWDGIALRIAAAEAR